MIGIHSPHNESRQPDGIGSTVEEARMLTLILLSRFFILI